MLSEKPSRLTVADLQSIAVATDYIHQHYANKLPADIIAQKAGMNKTRFHACFREAKGMTLHKYVQQLRIARASALLIDTNKPVKAIADLSGFPNESHFCRVFKKVTTFSPANFRFQQAI